jgi:hypothetical protein
MPTTLAGVRAKFKFGGDGKFRTLQSKKSAPISRGPILYGARCTSDLPPSSFYIVIAIGAVKRRHVRATLATRVRALC